jgi:hypothetical protein
MWNVIRVTTAVAMMTWMAATSPRLTAQDLGIERSEVAAIRVSVGTLAQHVGNFAGLRVRVADAIVARVVSPRAFILTSQLAVTGLGWREHVGVIIESGTATVVKGMPVMVTGAAGTFLGGQVSGILTRAEALTDAERAALRQYPLVVAFAVDTPNNINLLRASPPVSAPASPPTPVPNPNP